jgi:hypothetical protein
MWRVTGTALLICSIAVVSYSARPTPAEEAAANDPCKKADKQRYAARGLIRGEGYRCDTVKELCAYSDEYLVTCERYSFNLEANGGKWTVEAD